MKDMSMNYKNYIAWQEEVSRRAEVARRLRFALFVGSMAVVAAAVWAAVAYGLPALAQAGTDDALPDDGLWEAYHAEAVYCLERELDTRD